MLPSPLVICAPVASVPRVALPFANAINLLPLASSRTVPKVYVFMFWNLILTRSGSEVLNLLLVVFISRLIAF